MRAYDAIEFRHALWHYFTQTGGGEERQAEKKDSDSTEEKFQLFSQSFPFEQFFPIRNFSDKYVSDFLQ